MAKQLSYLIFFIFILPSHIYAQGGVGMLIEKEGDVFVKSLNGEERPVQLKDRIYVGDLIRTDAVSRAKIVFKENSILTLSKNTELKINRFYYDSQGRRSVEFELLKGRLRNIIPKTLVFPQFILYEVRTPTAVTGVRGTHFIVGYNPEQRLTEVFVLEGAIMVNDLIGGEVILHENQATRVYEGKGLTPPMEIPYEEKQRLEEEVSLPTSVDYVERVILEGFIEEERQIFEAEHKEKDKEETKAMVEDYFSTPEGDEGETPPLEQDVLERTIGIIRGKW